MRDNKTFEDHKPQKRYGEVCAIERDLCVFGYLLVFFSEVVIRERKLSNKLCLLREHGANLQKLSQIIGIPKEKVKNKGT